MTPSDLPEPPQDFADRPALNDAEVGRDADGRPHDLLSELLRSVRLTGERIVAHAPPRTFSIGVAETGALHIVEEGELVLRIDGDTHGDRVGRGDVILIPRGDPHHIGDASEDDVPAPAPARWLCGTFTIGDPQASHLLASLPAVIILRDARGEALEGLEVARRMLVIEMQSPSQGSAVMVARILDLLFIQILRVWAAGTAAEPNWLAGALDPQIGLALSAIHRDTGHDWTVGELARRAACRGRRSLRGSPLASGSRRPHISRTYAWTPPPTCSATPPFRSRSSRRRSATRRRRRSAVRSSAATACPPLAGAETGGRSGCERPGTRRSRPPGPMRRESGRGESNSRLELGRLLLCH